MGYFQLVCSVIIVLVLVSTSDGCTETYKEYRTTKTNAWIFGWFAKYKKTSYTARRCCSGWKNIGWRHLSCTYTCRGSIDHSTACHSDSESGGKCVGVNRCIGCNEGYYSDPIGKCLKCTPIPNCAKTTCTNNRNSVCHICKNEKTVKDPTTGKNEFSLKNNRCYRQCSWANGFRCFPGTCGGDMRFDNDCKCASNFGGTNCAKALKGPDITVQTLTLRRCQKNDTCTPPVILEKADVAWTNNKFSSLVEIEVTALQTLEGATPPPTYYINGSVIGVDFIDISVKAKRNVTSAEWKLHQTCKKEDANCKYSSLKEIGSMGLPIIEKGFQHLDELSFEVSTMNAGYITYLNALTVTEHGQYSITGKLSSNTMILKFDFQPPHHCFEDQVKCDISPLSTSSDFLTKDNLQLTWGGWNDSFSGLSQYKLLVYNTVLSGTKENPILKRDAPISINDNTYTAYQNTGSLKLPDAGTYIIELSAYDKAGNNKSASRIILYDDEPLVELQNAKAEVLASDRIFHWINKLVKHIDIIWPDRFINKNHSTLGWLCAVEREEDIVYELDDTTGVSDRTLDAIHNINGVVRYDIGYELTLNSVTNFSGYKTLPLQDFDKQSFSYDDIPIIDGTRLTFSVRGYDALDTYAEDNVTTWIDTSPPVIQDLWLTAGNVTNVTVHNATELNKLTFEWLVFDIHSGLHEISWKLFDNYTGDVIEHGSAHESPQGQASSIDDCKEKYKHCPRGPDCYCSPYNGCYHKHFQVKPTVSTSGHGLNISKQYGDHESDYYIEVKAVNNAGLESILHLKITIDVSPPHAGRVHDGLPGQPEVDYQQSLHLAAHWDDFFDKESGVWFYMYGYGTRCYNASDFDASHPSNGIFKTHLTNIEYDIKEPGTYYVTVVAYNHGLDSSEIVCSDGVTVDDTAAKVSNVVVDRAVVAPTVVKDTDSGKVYILKKDRELVEVDKPSTTCINKAIVLDASTVDLFPILRAMNSSRALVPSRSCDSMPKRSNEIISFITTDEYLDLSWNVTAGPGGIHDFEVGLATADTNVPDKMPFKSTHQHTFVRLFHSGIWDGDKFFILLKSISKAEVIEIQVIGPFFVITESPEAMNTIHVKLETLEHKQYLVATWLNHTFVDHGDINDLRYLFAIGSHKEAADIKAFTKLTPGGSCNLVGNKAPTCTAVDISSLKWKMHENKDYYIIIKAINSIGLFVLASSEKYTHTTHQISAGVVYDVDPEARNKYQRNDVDDIDFQIDAASLSVRWSGFHHPQILVTYSVCILEENGTIVECATILNNTECTFDGLHLLNYTTYFQKVTAIGESGNTTAISDGVTIVVKNDEHSFEVFDGPGCQNGRFKPVSHNRSHHDQNYGNMCTEDIEYQSSTNVIEAHWNIPADKRDFMQDIYWAVEKKERSYWTMHKDYEQLKSRDYLKVAGMFLESGQRYRISLKPCAKEFCFSPVFSSGVTVVHNPPSAGEMVIKFDEITTQLNVTMDMFRDTDAVNVTEAIDVIHCYEWAIGDNDDDSRILDKWHLVNTAIKDMHEQKLHFKIDLEEHIQFTKCWKLLVKGTTKAGLSTTISSEIKTCHNLSEVHPNIVIDALGIQISTTDDGAPIGGPIYLEENGLWQKPDVDYTPYDNIISATWPTLRHNLYEWAVLLIRDEDPSIFYESPEYMNLHNPCSHPDKIACGRAYQNVMNANFNPGVLQHGRRYIVCIHANATQIKYEKWTQHLETVCECSTGVTVDLTPPEPADAWIGADKHHYFQTSLSDMAVYWNSFTDVEEHKFVVHESGIESYQVAIGTSPGGNDIVDFADVGLTNHKTFTGLKLQNGHSYYATVKGFDFIGRSSKTVSHLVTVDNTPPFLAGKVITMPSRHITNTSFVSACWEGVFDDLESGIDYFYWSIGTNHGYEDVMEYTFSEEVCAETPDDAHFDLIEGHEYFITVKAYNKAGLFSSSTSWAFLVDETPPHPGLVYDGPRGRLYHDMDYIRSTDSISAHWTPFVDAHTTVKNYAVSFGTCPGCRDVMSYQAVGQDLDIDLNMLKLAEGIRYYTTVEACNTADLCTTASSDGFIVDRTAPTRGKVLDGLDGEETQYQSSRTFVGCKWYGFVDTQSGVSHYVWRVGTEPGGDDLVTPTCVHKQEEAFVVDLNTTFGKILPVGKRIYCTVRAYNGAGEHSEDISNGVIVDNTPPVFNKQLSLSHVGSIVGNTTILRSALKIEWDVEDKESNIEAQHISIASHVGGEFNGSSITVCGITRSYILTGLDLHDGSIYDIRLLSCNLAKLCSSSKIDDVLVDSTPPTMGGFAIDTNHAARLGREPDGWMQWNTISLNLAWLGFEDIHSGIENYTINVGSIYMGNDLNVDENSPKRVNHNDTGVYHPEDIIQTSVVRTKLLQRYKHVFVSIYATNKVGLQSAVLHGQFKLTYGGSLELVRRCEADSCEGHCVCAPTGHMCDHQHRMCNNLTTDISPITVEDVVNVFIGEDRTISRYSPVDTYIAAQWNHKNDNHKKALWYEWSVGESHYDEPLGIFDKNHERVWHDAGTEINWVYTLPRGNDLDKNGTYSFFVRAWYDKDTYVVYKSPGARILSKRPQTTSLRGASVKEVIGTSMKDVDYFTNTSLVKADWSRKFIDNNDISKFHLYIGTRHGGNDFMTISSSIPPSRTSYNISGLALVEDTKYYTVVQAFNHAGFHYTVTSDGFVVDNEPPVPGVVNDGKGLHDLQYVNTESLVSAFWHGFSDIGSGIDRYEHCASTPRYKGRCDILQATNVGLHTMVTVNATDPIKHGDFLYNEVRAYDMAGMMTDFISSDGFVVDQTPPNRVFHHLDDTNIIQNPSFESSQVNETWTKDCIASPDGSWMPTEESCIKLLHSPNAPDGNSVILIQGTVYQTVNIRQSAKYSLEFHTSNMPHTKAILATVEGMLEIGNDTHVFMMHSKPSNGSLVWQKHYFVLSLNPGLWNFTIGVTRVGSSFALDKVELKRFVKQNSEELNGNHIKSFSTFSHDWSSIHAAWSFEDPESGIVEYLWAIGTVKGGTQLMDFTSVGRTTYSSTNSLKLVHSTQIYVTVVAVNGAGLRTASYSDPVTIDLTPPVFVFIHDGHSTDRDEDFQTHLHMHVRWQVNDPESGVDECYWAIGTSPHDTSTKPFEKVSTGARSASIVLTKRPADRLYSTVRCYNDAGLAATISSDGIKILSSSLMINEAFVEVMGASKTQYQTKENYHGDPNEIKFRWTGFSPDEGINTYVVGLSGRNVSITESVVSGTFGFNYAAFTDVQLNEGLYEVSVSAINEINMNSQKRTSQFKLLTSTPQPTGVPVTTDWSSVTSKASASWTGVFKQNHPLFYEVTVRQENGDGNIVQWQETTSTEITVDIDEKTIPKDGATLYFAIRAINHAGYFSSVTANLAIIGG